MEEKEEEKRGVRVFVGGLGENVSGEDLRRLFGSLGTVESLETIRTKGRSFAYIDFLPSPSDPNSLSKLFSKYNGCVWKGGKLRLEKAKEHYLTRLKKEWEEDANVNSQQQPTDVSAQKDSEEKMANKKLGSNSITKTLNIFFPRLRKVKSIPLSGSGKHKYSFQNIKVPPLPVHFCDCEEHCSPFVTAREKASFDVAAEIGGMNDEEINIMNAVMNKLFEKEMVSNTQHLGKVQDSFESPDALHLNECEVDSATDDDDLIINIETTKNKSPLTGSQELERIMENQESWLNKTRIAKEEPNKSMLQVQKRSNSNPNKVKKRKSLPELENETPGGKSNMQTLPDELGSGAQPTEHEYDFGESTKVSWSQKSSWRKLLGEGGNTAFSASFILPKFDSGKDQQRSDGPCAPLSTNDKTEDMASDGSLESKPTDTQVIEEPAETQPTNTQAIEEPAETQPTNKQVIDELAEAQHNVAPKNTGRGDSWLKKQSWTQLVSADNTSFSISQILPGISFPEPVAEEPIVDPANSNDCKHNDLDKDAISEVASDEFKLGEIIPEKSQHAGATDIAFAPVVEEKIEDSPKERSTADVEIGETCSFMRSAASLKEWAKAKAALSGSLKRKRSEK